VRLETTQSSRAIDRYLEAADDDAEYERRRKLVYDAIVAIVGGVWYQLYEHWDELSWPGCVVMSLSGPTLMVWRVVLEEPGVLRIVFVGDVGPEPPPGVRHARPAG
jgi:hypothetical protein